MTEYALQKSEYILRQPGRSSVHAQITVFNTRDKIFWISLCLKSIVPSFLCCTGNLIGVNDDFMILFLLVQS